MMLIGAHLERAHVEPVKSVTPVDLGQLVLSALEIDPNRGSSDPALLRTALQARDELLDLATFIAIRWGTIVGSRDAALDKCASRLPRWRSRLEKTRDLVEMTFKVGGREKPKRPDFRHAASGKDYLRKLHEMRRDVEVDTPLLSRATELFGPIATELRQIRREDGGAEIALLVSRERVESIADAGRRLQEEMPRSPFLLSGPWPLEAFADEE